MLYPSFSDFMTAAIKRAESTIGAHSELSEIMSLLEMGWGNFMLRAIYGISYIQFYWLILSVGNQMIAEYESSKYNDAAVSRLLERTAESIINNMSG